MRLATKCILFFGSLEKRGCEYSKERERNGSHAASVTSRWESFGGFKCFVATLSPHIPAPTHGQVPDGTLKITSRMVAPGIGLSWGEGVLTYNGRDYPFTFKATGLFRDVDTKIAAAELSGQVFDLKKPEDFGGNYQKVEMQTSESGSTSRATMKNQNGVVVNLASTINGRKFNLAP